MVFYGNYLSKRVHRVSLDSYSSTDLPVKSRVPQGSILGPLLFLVYVNDIFSVVSSSCLLEFADDTQCFRSVHCPADCLLLQEDLDAISDWSDCWNLKFKVPKCAHLRFGSVSPDSSFTINGVPVPTVTVYKDVGVLITSNLSFTPHLNRILSKAYNSLGMVRRVVPSNSNMDLKRTLYLTLVRSQVTYCCQVWRPYLVQDSRALERLQRRASKYILNDHQLTYKSRLISMDLLPLTLWMEMQDVFLLLGLLKYPPDNFDLSQYICFVQSSTRSSSTGKITASFPCTPRLNSTRHYYFNRIIKIWNSLPPLDLDSPLSILKSLLRNLYWDYFINHYSTESPCSWYRVCPCSNCAPLPVQNYPRQSH